jgi:asparagine synthase (glutamine-hydrolysing)
MCGIVGFLEFAGPAPDRMAFLRRGCAAVAHRGPDGEGVWVDGPVGFGHRRLSIIDLESGDQPMRDGSGRYCITYNGEIYNYRELRDELTAKGMSFRTKSDTEVILNAYAQWGADCVERLNGIFAFALWDADERSLLLARDHLGVKPLLYALTPDRLLFATDLSALAGVDGVDGRVDLEALSDYLSLGYVLSPKTILRGVRKLPPASMLVCRGDGRVRVERFWDLAAIANAPSREFRSDDAAAAAALEVVEEAVTAQLVSDVPVGAFLSGGIDSSTIAFFMHRQLGPATQTFSLGFDDASFDESRYFHLMAKHLATRHHEETMPAGVASALPEIVRLNGEPFADTSAVPTFFLSQLARRHVKVALSGDGGDEAFGGYETYLADKAHTVYARLPRWVHTTIVTPALRMLPVTYGKVSWDYKLRQFAAYAYETPEAAHCGWRTIFSESQKAALMTPDVYRALGGYTPADAFRAHYADVPTASPLNRLIYVDFKTWLCDDILVKTDRAGMAHGLEVRVPLLDRRVVEFAMALPERLKVRGLRTKYLLKRAMRSALPPAILHRSKRGFNAPVSAWMQTWPTVRAGAGLRRLLPGVSAQWDDLVASHARRRNDEGLRLWTLLVLNLWSEAAAQAAPAPVSP